MCNDTQLISGRWLLWSFHPFLCLYHNAIYVREGVSRMWQFDIHGLFFVVGNRKETRICPVVFTSLLRRFIKNTHVWCTCSHKGLFIVKSNQNTKNLDNLVCIWQNRSNVGFLLLFNFVLYFAFFTCWFGCHWWVICGRNERLANTNWILASMMTLILMRLIDASNCEY